jgi:transcriptional regulator with XRE-family HTH domain
MDTEEQKMFFGKKLKELRINKKIGIHKFKDAMGTTLNVSELYEIENGYTPPPDCGRFIAQIRKALEVEETDLDWLELLNLRYNQPFVMQKMETGLRAGPLTHKVDGTYLTSDEHQSLNEYIESIAVEHNKKADAYNAEHGVS